MGFQFTRGSALSSAEIQAAVQRYTAGENALSIARSLSVSQPSVVKTLRAAGCELRLMHKVSPDTWAAAAAAYAAGERGPSVARRYGVCHDTLLEHVRKLGFRVRHQGEDNKYRCDESFFAVIDSEAKAYWIGFLAADGCVTDRGDIILGLAIRDLAQLEKFRTSLGAEHRIRLTSGITFGALRRFCDFRLCSRKMAADLARHGVGPRKSFSACPSTEIPAGLIRHYWRGVIDGDGSLGTTARKCRDGTSRKPEWRVSAVGSRAMMEGLAAFFRSVCGTMATARPHKTIWEVRVSGNHIAKTAMLALYGGATIYLDRKFARFTEAMLDEAPPPTT